MPDIHGFDHLPNRGSIRLRCIWCGLEKRPSASVKSLECHSRKHEKDWEQSREESIREANLRAAAAGIL